MNKDEIVRLAAEVAISIWERQWIEQRREQRNMRLWNTRMLLKHYKSLKKYCEKAVYGQQQGEMSSESPRNILEMLGSCSKETYLDSVKSSVLRTRAIMAHVDAMIKLYQIYCDTSLKPEDKRRYRIFEAIYLSDERGRMEDLCQSEHIDRSTYYRDVKESTEMLCALIFGADGLAAMRN